jgi:hypothetical protein
VGLRRIADILGGIEPEPIEVVFFNPVARILHEKLPYRLAVRAIEIDGLAPLILVPVGEVIGREGLQKVTVGPDVVVDNVQDYPQAVGMRCVNKPA